MNFNTVTIEKLPATPSPRNILRRLGAVDITDREDIEKNFREDWMQETLNHCVFKGVWRLMPAGDLPFCGDLTGRILSGCNWAVLMAVTAGDEVSGWIKSLFASADGAKGAFADAVTSEGVESALNYMQKSVTNSLLRSGISLKKARISPGFGDFDLSCQRDLLELLECRERLGIMLNDVFFMTPEKSTTALTGGFDIVSPTTKGGVI